ncbi:hypothetical protein CCHR01_13980 [Colletotrichum chrysophilum]|uniref:Uncharacterized protein n=1 Tax=Colletotrichum chrysophilum TaxID=1836956 RepID=A0AAD9A8G1_9PEZI|nr:hypothetical protein CCHR01_13980 [Colletotrichum chrysophilum]
MRHRGVDTGMTAVNAGMPRLATRQTLFVPQPRSSGSHETTVKAARGPRNGAGAEYMGPSLGARPLECHFSDHLQGHALNIVLMNSFPKHAKALRKENFRISAQTSLCV